MSAAAAKRTVLAAVSIALLGAIAVAGPASGNAPGKQDRVPPTTPKNLRVTSATPSAVIVEWDQSQDDASVAGYYVYGDKGRETVSIPSDTRPDVWIPAYEVKSLSCGESATIAVEAFDFDRNRSDKASTTVSTAACQDAQPPTTPSGFRQQATTRDSVVLAWDTSSDNVGVVGYGVYRNLQRIGASAEPAATLEGLSCGWSYNYAVDAVDAAGNRSLLGTAYVQTASCSDGQPPSAPTGLTVTSRTTTSLAVSWSPSNDNVGVTGYRVSVGGSPVMTVSQTSASVSNLSCGTSYVVGVDAFDAAGNRSPATAVNAATDTCPPPPPSGDTTPPSTPTGLGASNVSQTGLTLAWNASNDNVAVTGYDVYRNGTKVVSVTSTSSSQTGLSCGTSHTFAVVARDAAGNSSQPAQLGTSTLACSTTPPPSADTTPPSQPTSLRISSVTGTSVTLIWGPSTDNVGVAGYRTYVNGTPVSTSAQPGAMVSSLTCGTAYTFEVDAYDAAGNRSARASVIGSTAACADTQPPTAPVNVSATSRTTTSIALSWSPSSDNVGVVGYGLYKGGAVVATASETTGIFSGLACNTNYTLSVDAYDAAGNGSDFTTVMVATTACPDTTPPSSPTGLAASNITQTGLTLTWTASSDNVGVTGYDVYRNGSKMATVASTSSSQTGLACGTSYTFGVVAFDVAGNSSQQAQVMKATTACSTPPSTGPITITAGGTYTGVWVGNGSGPTVRIATSSPVVIENSVVKNTGAASLIDASYPGAQLTVRRTTLEGAPGSVGKAVYGNGFKSVRVENCTINYTWGIRLDAIQAGGTIVVTRNKGRNMQLNTADRSHFFQAANHTQQPALIDVSWNEIVNEFGKSGVEDVINIYGAGYAKIHDNYIQGAYPESIGGGYAGSGIMLDSGAHDNEVWGNIVVDTVNAGIGIASGRNNSVHDNRVVFDGRDDGGNLFAAANIGIYVWNYDGNPTWGNNHATSNMVGWVKANGQRNDLWFPDAPSTDYATNSALANPISRATEQSEYQNWLGKLASNGISVGA